MADQSAVRTLVVGVDADATAAAAERLAAAADDLSVAVETDSDAVGAHLESVDCVVGMADADTGEAGVDLVRSVRRIRPELPTVLYPAEGSESLAAAAVAAGVTEYVPRTRGVETLAERVLSSAGQARGPSVSADLRNVLERVTDAFFALDENWTFTYVNDRAEELLDIDEAAIGESLWDLFPAAVDTTFQREYERAMETQDPVHFEEFYPPLDTWFEVRAYPSETGLSVYFRDVTARRERRERLEAREQSLRRVYDVVADQGRSFTEKVEALLDVGCDVLGTNYGTLSRIEDGEYFFEVVRSPGDDVQAGDRMAASETNCERVVDTGETLAVEDIGSDPELSQRAGYTELGVSCYLGAPVFVDDGIYGAFCFYDTHPREETFSDWERTFVDLLGRWASYELGRVERERTLETQRAELSALNHVLGVVNEVSHAIVRQSTRPDVERVVCESLANAESFAAAWIGDVGDDGTVSVRQQAGFGDADPVEFAVDPAEMTGADADTDATESHITTETVDADPSLATNGATPTLTAAFIPLVYEGEELGTLAIYTDRQGAFAGRERDVVATLGDIVGHALRSITYERRLEHERERLAFINRVIRHDFANALNVIEARTEIVDDFVEAPGETHLETVKRRTRDLIERAETMREYVKAVAETTPGQLEPRPLDDVVTAEAEKVRLSYDAEIDVDVPSVDVYADDLLESVFENLLTNAVVHNDGKAPRVAVTAALGEEVAEVRVADNGPGIPADIRESVFARGAKGEESGGTGLGLHVVKEAVESYGGHVRVEETDSGGSVFVLTIPRA